MTELNEIVLSENTEIRDKFLSHFKQTIMDIAVAVEVLQEKLKAFDKSIKGNRQKALVECVFYNIINDVIAATQLLTAGYQIPAGNLMRQAIESLFLAILCSRGDLDYLNQILSQELYTYKAANIVLDCPVRFGMLSDGADFLKLQREHYHHFSHPTLFALSSQFDFSQEGAYQIGPFFDESKIENYRREFESMLNFLKALPNAFDGLLQNAKWLDKDRMDELWNQSFRPT